MHSAPAQTGANQDTVPDGMPVVVPPRASGATPPSGPHDTPAGVPPLPYPPEPVLQHRRDGILPNVAAALTVHGATLTGTAARGDLPDLHPLVRAFLDELPIGERDRFTGRCAETLLISRHLDAADAERNKKRTKRKPMSHGEARKALKNATLTARRIREEGDPLHGTVVRPCRACTALAAHLGVRIVAPAHDSP